MLIFDGSLWKSRIHALHINVRHVAYVLTNALLSIQCHLIQIEPVNRAAAEKIDYFTTVNENKNE